MISTFTVVGGGSAYAPGLVAALLHHRAKLPDLQEVRLWDLDEHRLSIVARLSEKLARPFGLRVRAARSLEDALLGTDAILNSTRPGGLEARALDEKVPIALGLPGQETVGPGGFFFAMRSVPQAIELAAARDAFANDAWILNYTNPTNIVTQALVDRGVPRVLGLCDQSEGDLDVLSRALGAQGEAHFRSTGTNHATWYGTITFGGVAPRLPTSISELRDVEHHDEEHAVRFRRSVELAREAGGEVWPNSYLPYYTHPDDFVRLAVRTRTRAEIILEKLPAYYRHFEEEAEKDAPVLRHHRGTAGFGDLAVMVLAALSRPAGQHLVLNVESRGHAPGYADDTVTELLVHVRPSSSEPRVVLELEGGPPTPRPFIALASRLERYQRAAARAIARGSSTDALADALAENPIVGRVELARTLLARRAAA